MTPKLELQIEINYGAVRLVNEDGTVLAEINHDRRPWYSSAPQLSSFSIGDKKITLSRTGRKVDILENDQNIGNIGVRDRNVIHLNAKDFDLRRPGGREIYYVTDQKNPIVILTRRIHREGDKSLLGIFYSPGVLYYSLKIAEGQEIHYELLRLVMISGYLLQKIFETSRS